MLSKHGTLESAILSTLWNLESQGIYTNSVKDVYEILSKTDKKAYTTVKTVMDRLFEKNILLRFKQGRKFYYRTAYSNYEVVVNSIREIANRYCNGDVVKLSAIIRGIEQNQFEGQLVGV